MNQQFIHTHPFLLLSHISNFLFSLFTWKKKKFKFAASLHIVKYNS